MEKIQNNFGKNKVDFIVPLRFLITMPQLPSPQIWFSHCLCYSHQHGGAPAHGLGGGNETFCPSGILGVELLHRRGPLWTETSIKCHFTLYKSKFSTKKSSLTLPLSTMSLCRSLEDSTSTLMACMRSVQDAKILQGATESNTSKACFACMANVSGWMQTCNTIQGK